MTTEQRQGQAPDAGWKALEQRVKAHKESVEAAESGEGTTIRTNTSKEFHTQVESMQKTVMASSSATTNNNTSNTALSDLSTTTKSDKAASFTRRRLARRCLFGLLLVVLLAFLTLSTVIFALDVRSQRQYGSQTKPAGQDPSHDKFDGTYSANASPQRPTSVLAGLRNSLGISSDADTFDSNHAHLAIYDLLHHVVSPTDPYDSATQIPFLFIADEMLRCFPLTQAGWIPSRVGRRHEGAPSADLQILPGNPDERGSYLDVDLSTLHGLQRAQDYFLFDRHLADFVASPFLPEILDMFPDSHRGRIFTMLMDPIARVKAGYNHLIQNSYITGSLLEFVSSNHLLANDYTVRTLTGKWDVNVPVGPGDVNTALDVLRTKFHVGVMRYYKEWMISTIQTFGWDHLGAYQCLFPEDAPPHPPPPEPDALEIQVRSVIERHNTYDHMLLEAVADQWERYGGFPRWEAEAEAGQDADGEGVAESAEATA